MFTVALPSALRPVSVLLGGTGRARTAVLPRPALPALLMPFAASAERDAGRIDLVSRAHCVRVRFGLLAVPGPARRAP